MTKRLVYAVLVLMGVIALSLCWPDVKPVQAAPERGAVTRQPGGEINPPAYTREDRALTLREYDEPSSASEVPVWRSVLSMLFKLLIVVGLIVLSLGLFKQYFQGKLPLPGLQNKQIMVLESSALSPQHSVYLVSVTGERIFFLGATPAGLSVLSEFTDPEVVKQILQANRANSSFGRLFEAEEALQGEPPRISDRLDGRRRGASHEWEG